MKWAFRECIAHFAHRLPKGRTTCMDCGHSWIMSEQTKQCTCPECGARLEVRLTYARKVQQKQYFTILTTSGEYQVLRMFLLIVEMEKDSRRNLMRLKSGSIGGTRRDARLSWAYNGYLADIWTLSLLARLWLSGRTTSLMTTFHIAPCIRKSELLTH